LSDENWDRWFKRRRWPFGIEEIFRDMEEMMHRQLGSSLKQHLRILSEKEHCQTVQKYVNGDLLSMDTA